MILACIIDEETLPCSNRINTSGAQLSCRCVNTLTAYSSAEACRDRQHNLPVSKHQVQLPPIREVDPIDFQLKLHGKLGMSALTYDARLMARLLDTIDEDILPLTEAAVRKGNKVFGAELVKKSDLTTYLAETNNEMESPLHHGEMHLLKRYYEQPVAHRLSPQELIFLSTHEPCSLCLSAITWGAFDNFFYFFSHADSRDQFAIPHDLKILKEVFDVEPGGYRHDNAFWQCQSIPEWLATHEDELSEETRKLLGEKAEAIRHRYAVASDVYQSGKSANDIPLN